MTAAETLLDRVMAAARSALPPWVPREIFDEYVAANREVLAAKVAERISKRATPRQTPRQTPRLTPSAALEPAANTRPAQKPAMSLADAECWLGQCDSAIAALSSDIPPESADEFRQAIRDSEVERGEAERAVEAARRRETARTEATTLPDHVIAHDLTKLDARIQRQATVIARTRPVWDKPNVIPGPLATGRSGYTMGRQLDAENDRKAKAFREHQEAHREHGRLQAIRAGYLAGTLHPNGQPRVAGAVEARGAARERQVTKNRALGYDTRKIHRELSIDGFSRLDDGRVVAYEMNFDLPAGDGGYRYTVRAPDGAVVTGRWHGSISKMEGSGELRKMLAGAPQRTKPPTLFEQVASRIEEAEALGLLPWQSVSNYEALTRNQKILADAWGFALRAPGVPGEWSDSNTALRFILADDAERSRYPSAMGWTWNPTHAVMAAAPAGWDVDSSKHARIETRLTRDLQDRGQLARGETALADPRAVEFLQRLRAAARPRRKAKR
jgi:hypothetical protein